MHRSVISTVGSLALALALVLTVARAQQEPLDQKNDVLRITTELVQTDVTVVDKQGRFVDGLKAEQFELLVDGKPQNISFFERISAGSRRPLNLVGDKEKDLAKDAGKESLNTTASAPMPGRTIFFFVDDMHLSPNSMVRTKESLQQFVNNTMGESDQIAITTASGQLGFLQQLTGDKAVLKLAIERLKPRSYEVSDMQLPPMTEYHAYAIEQGHTDVKEVFVEQTCKDVLKVRPAECSGAAMTNNAVLDETPSGTAASTNRARWKSETIVKQRARVITRQAAHVILGTLLSLETLVRRAAPLPQRKLLIFLSEGFFINFVSSSQVYDLRRITDAASRSGTVIYTMDARGLTSGVQDATKSGLFDHTGRMARVNLAEIRTAQQPLFNLAVETGGQAWLNSNSLDDGVSRAINETSNYYRLAWRPEDRAQTKPAYRKLKITVKDRPDLAVRVPSGFFTEDPELAKTEAATSGLSVDDQLMAAIRASYPRRGMPLIISAGYLNTEKDGLVLAASIQLESMNAASGAPGGAEIDLLGVLVDEQANIVSSLKQKLNSAAGPNSTSSFTTLQFIRIPPGLYQVRVAARDSQSGRIASAAEWIEIPNTLQNNFSLSSIFLSEGPIASPGSAQKWIIKPDRTFEKSSKLKFQAFVYNADRTADPPRVHLQMELQREGQILVQTPASAVATEGISDLARIPIVGEFPLSALQPGRYALKLTVTDSKSKSTVSRHADFVIR